VDSGIAIQPGYSEGECTSFTFRTSSFTIIRTLLLLSSRRRDRLNEVEFGFGVRKLLRPLDLQTPVFVGNEMCDEDRFAGSLNPDRGLRLVGHL
jgi:hypothetical protein